MSNIKVTIIQTQLFWEQPAQNRKMLEEKIRSVETHSEIVVLPEMFTTGFTMNPAKVAEPPKGDTFQWMKNLAKEMDMVITGSFITREGDKYYNRLLWMQPDGVYHQYDKNHLFSFAGENKYYTPGNEKVIVDYKGWKILLMICYDLRFPVWTKNNYSHEKGFDYDCILCVANWPGSRSHPWRVLLMARAIENQCFVIGVNRIGKDGNGIEHSGDSALISPLGENFSNIMPFQEVTETIPMPRCQLDDFRGKFKVALDWDQFNLNSLSKE